MNNTERRSEYLQKLRDPRWQKKRLQIMERDEFACVTCGDATSTLNVHHKFYRPGAEPWEYPPAALVTLCETCHEKESESAVSRKDVEREIIEVVRVENFDPHEVVSLLSSLAYHRITPGILAAAIRNATPDLSIGRLRVITQWEEADEQHAPSN